MGKTQNPRRPRLPARARKHIGCISLLYALLLTAAASTHAQKVANDPLPTVAPLQLAPPPAGMLRPIGGYPVGPLREPAIARLPNGQVFIYGISPDDGRRDASNQPVWTLRHRDRYVSYPYTPAPLLWNPQQHAWSRLTQPPECTDAAFLHTATALPNGKVLIAGGLCDHPKEGNDDTPQAPYAHLSLWNSASGAWESAPSLQQPRIYHTATVLDDGSVLLIGGESDPALSPEREPVLTSVEHYRDGKLEPFPSLLTARARHTATVLRDGSVLVAGGIDEHGTAIAAAELWDASRHAWRTLPPLAHARYAHTATLLDDGRVLIAGGYDREGHPQDSVELWDPAHAAWSTGAPLPHPLQNHAATKLANGDVLVAGGLSDMAPEMIDWAFVWTPATDTWHPAGRLRPDTPDAVTQKPLLAAQPDGTALIFGTRQILQWRPLASNNNPGMAELRSKPALAALAGNQLMAIARTDGPTWTAQIWDPATDHWQRAGTLAYRDGRDTAAIQLRSGRVLHLGFGAHNELWCELGGTSDMPWTGCGQLALQKVADTPIGLGLLPDGRAALIANADEAFVFDEISAVWTPAPLEWNEKDLTYGAPIRIDHPLARLRDPAHDAWLDVSAIAARYWENVYPRRQATVSFSNGTQQAVSSRPNPPTLLWDPDKREWAYVFLYGTMGINAQRLPDGCALSWTPLTLFDPRSGKVTKLTDPGIGVRSFEGSMLALADGTVVIAGVPDGGVGSGFFHRKASCAGFADERDGVLAMPGVFVGDLPQAPPPAAPEPAKPAPPHTNALVAMVKDNPWPWLAALGTLLLYLLLRYAVLPLVRHLSRRTLTQHTRDALTRKLPSPFAWITRLLIYGALAAFCVLTIRSFLHFRQKQTEQACSERASLCVDTRTDLLQSVPALEAAPGHPKPAIPCRYVGVWSSRNGGLMFRITLKDDGTFVEEPNAAGYGNPAGYTGYWVVQGDYMVWRDNARPALGPDINRILEPSDSAFTLVEGNGSHTRFERIQAVPSNRCTP